MAEFFPRQGPEYGAEQDDLRRLVRWVESEFQRLARAQTEAGRVPLQVHNVEVERPRDGELYFADGTNWNPGAGAGTYERVGGVYRRLHGVENNEVTNAMLADMAAYTLKGRNAGTTGDPSDIDISALTEKTTLVDNDLFLIQDSAASNAFKKVKKSNVSSVVKGILVFSGGTATIAAALTRYLGAGGLQATESNTYAPVAFAMTFTDIRYVGNDPGASQTVTVTLRKNATTSTALTCQVTSGTNVASGSASVAFAAGDRLAIDITTSAGANTQGPVSVGLGYTIP